jgi:hypothetical protein
VIKLFRFKKTLLLRRRSGESSVSTMTAMTAMTAVTRASGGGGGGEAVRVSDEESQHLTNRQGAK